MELSNIYEMTPLQQGLLIESQKHKGNYVSRMIVYLKKEINYEILKESIKLLIEENEILRTRFVFGKNKKNISAIYNNIDLNDYIGTKDDYNIFPHQSFDFEESKNKLIWSHHHALLDGWSVTLLLNRLNEIYFEVQEKNYKNNKIPQFSDYINWLNNQNKSEAKHYWNKKIDMLQSPTLVKMQDGDNDTRIIEYNFKLDKEISRKIKQIVKNNRWTMNDFIQSIWSITLSCIVGKDNFSYGIVSSGRNPEVDRVGEIAGLFINTIPQVIDLKKYKKFKDLIEYVRRSQNESQKYEYLSLTEIKRNSHMKDSKELFNTLFVYENYPELSTNENMIFDKIEGKEQAHYPLVFSVGYNNCILCKLQFNEQYFSEGQIKDIESLFSFFTEKLSNSIETPIEIAKLCLDINQSMGAVLSSENIIDERLFEIAKLNPDKIAIKNGDSSLNYNQLKKIICNNIKKINENYDINKINTIGIQYSRGVKAIIGMLTATILKIPY
ncbi:condensation domain-containing protein, partial [Staphylococcus caprae]|uniref:condensation domain-containing protein n=1 Tax=Staphylococcus caprae TaxID=29380 RepID=UPI003B21FF1D